MKKHFTAACLLAVLSLLLILLPGCGQQPDTVTVYCLSGITTAASNKLFTYDARGNLLEEYYENPDNEYTRVYTYDENGNLLTDVSYDAQGNQRTDLLSYTYDEQGNQLTKEQTDPEGKVTTYSYTYDEQGNLLSENHVTEYGAVQPRIKYTYDSRGDMLTKTQFDNLGRQTEQYRYTYDEQGNLLSEERLRAGEVVYKALYTYDKNGNMLSKEEEVGGTSRYQWTYDPQGNILTELHLREGRRGTTSSSIKYSYDGSGNLLEEVGPDYTIKITYDQNGRKTSGELIRNKTRYGCTYDENENMSYFWQKSSAGLSLTELDYIRLELPREALEKVQEEQRELLRTLSLDFYK